MKESLIDKLDRLEKEINKLKTQLSTVNKSKAPDVAIDIESKIVEIVDEKFVTNLYRNK